MELFDGGLFDINGDGKTSLDEEYIAFRVFCEVTRDEQEQDDDFDDFKEDDDFDDESEDDEDEF